MKSVILSILIVFSLPICLAQTDTSLTSNIIKLDPVNIETHRFSKYSGSAANMSIVNFQSLPLNANEALEKISPAFIKNYGPGSLSTISLRGTGASHTAMLWEGFSIISPLNSTADLSLIPISLFDIVQLELGNSTSLTGSGATGGTLHLQSKPNLNQGEIFSQVRFTGASFHQNDILAAYAINSKKFKHQLKYNYQSARNNFKLLTLNNQRQNNARSEIHNLTGQFSYQINPSNNIEYSVWVTSSNRQLSPSLLSSKSLASQQDQSLRNVLSWNHTSNNWGIKIRTALFEDKLRYINPLTETDDVSGSLQSINEIEFRRQFQSSHEINVSGSFQYIKGTAPAYSTLKSQWRGAVFASYKWSPKVIPLSCVANIRFEQINKFTSPFIASASIQYQPVKYIRFSVKGGRTYRYPGFNDLFWTPGGNPNLLPEKGWTFESGADLTVKKKFWYGRLNTVIHGQKVNNWIIWLPGDTYWSPQNIRNVFSRGLEVYLENKFVFKNVQVSANITYTYTRSTWEKSYLENDRSTGKQLIYEPMHKALFLSECTFKGMGVLFRYIYTGLRYTSSDNAQSLAPYHLLEAEISYNRKISIGMIRAFAGAYNLGNYDYQIIQNRAMPGRYFKLGIELTCKTRIHS